MSLAEALFALARESDLVVRPMYGAALFLNRQLYDITVRLVSFDWTVMTLALLLALVDFWT